MLTHQGCARTQTEQKSFFLLWFKAFQTERNRFFLARIRVCVRICFEFEYGPGRVQWILFGLLSDFVRAWLYTVQRVNSPRIFKYSTS